MIRTAELASAIRQLGREPMPPFPSHITPDFPLEILPPFVRRLVIEVAQLSMAPASSIVPGFLCGLATCVQGLLLVQKTAHQISPVGLSFIVSLDSGERKTSSLAPLFAGINAFERENTRIDTASMIVFRAQMDAWESVRNGLLKAGKKGAEKGEDTNRIYEKLAQHEAIRPKARPRFRSIFEKATVAALIGHLAENIPSTALITDEALTVLSGSSSHDFGILNKLMDGAPFRSDTFQNSIDIESPSLTFGVWGQSQVVNEFVLSKDNRARATGFLARCFIVKPVPTSGNRYISPHEDIKTTEALDVFNRFCRRCLELTRESLGNNISGKAILRFSHQANEMWHDYYNRVEHQIGLNAELQPYRDLASKQADKVARIAALFHCLDGDGELISDETMRQAINVGDWLFRQTISFFNNSQFEQIPKLAVGLYNWLVENYRMTGKHYISRTELMKFGPSNLRCRATLLPVLDLLCRWGKVWIGNISGGGRTLYVGLQPVTQQS
jgi:hypothetical protein